MIAMTSLAMITMPSFPHNAKDMLTSSTIFSTQDQDEHAKAQQP